MEKQLDKEPNIKIERNKFGGVSYTILSDINYEDIKLFCDKTKDDKFFLELSKTSRGEIYDLVRYEKEVTHYLNIIQQFAKHGSSQLNKEVLYDKISSDSTDSKEMDFIDIEETSPKKRYVIYNLCKLLKLKFIRLDENTRRYVGCNEFIPINERKYKLCGCDYAPSNFGKYHVTNNYEDTISYSSLPWTYKLGVRIYRKT